MFQIDLKSHKAIYEQVVDNFKELIMTGVMKPGEKIPSVRELSKELTINPNTIQKAYRELEKKGYIYSVSGIGNFVSVPDDLQVNRKRIDELKENVRASLKELVFLGCPDEEIIEIFNESELLKRGDSDDD